MKAATRPSERRLKMRVRDRRRETEEIVLGLLQTNGLEKRWSDMEDEALRLNLSTATLARALKKFTQLRIVTRRVDDSTYPPTVYYGRRDPTLFPTEFMEVYRLSKELSLVGDIVEEVKGKGKTLDIYEAAMKVHTQFAQAALPALLYASLGGKGPYVSTKTGEEKKEELEKILAQMRVDIHALADELLDTVIRPWIHELLEVLNIFHSSSKSLLEEESEPTLRKAIRSLREYDQVIKPFREASRNT